MDVNSIPVSNYKFGHVKTSFEVNVSNDEDSSSTDMEPSQVTNVSTTTAIPITNESNVIAIIGQDAPYYNPDRITINSGTTLTFRNHDAIMHTVTGTDDGNTVVSPTSNNSFDTGILGIGQEKQITFDKPGTYNYFCAVHPFMRGIVSIVS
jgi:plastocyanin